MSAVSPSATITPGRAPRRAPLPTVLGHWILVLAFATSFATGLRIASDAQNAPVSSLLAPVLPQGDVLLWHLASAGVLLAILIAYLLYQKGTGLGRRFFRLPRAADTSAKAVRAMRLRRLDLLLYWLAFALLVIAAASGLMQYTGAGPVANQRLETLHLAAAWGMILYLVLHVTTQIAAGGPRRLLSILLPGTGFLAAGAVAGVVAIAALIALAGVDRMLLPDLDLSRTERPPTLDGRPDDSQWQRSRPLRLRLTNGANLPGGETLVTLRGLHDDEHVYLLCEWDDPTLSRKHVPIVKTDDGWRIVQTAYRNADESVYYEDKLALMLAPSNPFAAIASIHLGQQPLAGEPGPPGGRGLHYTTDGSLLDVWHWKSVRNAAEGQADDNFFGPPYPAPRETPRMRDPDSGAWIPRYTAGYRKDPPGTYSGYEMNWELFDEGEMLPLRLPDDPAELPDPGVLSLSAQDSDDGDPRMTGWMEYNDTHPYAAGVDDLPEGSLLPSVLPTGPLTGDRADIRARGRWQDGRWHLELARRLDTGSARDVPVTDGTLLWVAVFDHAQTRHAYHLRPVRIRVR